jgi:hypothetical protein
MLHYSKKVALAEFWLVYGFYWKLIEARGRTLDRGSVIEAVVANGIN